ncbi:hypothetical protein [Aneurinibacillus sp. REN35]|uniref:hypothetical protein n=1 Tax=Aneurinibacillus sp. REN35 TaxID=3237286 RepID=UPI00352735B6
MVDDRDNVIPFPTREERRQRERREKQAGIPPRPISDKEQLLQLVFEYRKQCGELFELCVKSRLLVIEYRKRYMDIYEKLQQEREKTYRRRQRE